MKNYSSFDFLSDFAITIMLFIVFVLVLVALFFAW